MIGEQECNTHIGRAPEGRESLCEGLHTAKALGYIADERAVEELKRVSEQDEKVKGRL